jgi:hypothetical protein
MSEDGNVQATITCHRRSVDLLRYLPIPAEVALALVEAGPQRFVGSRAEDCACAQARADLQVELPGLGSVTRSACVGFGPLMEEDEGAAVLPVWWEDAEHPDLFPTFDGGLELYRDGRGTALRLVGSYVPPFGLLGRFGDGLAGHRIVVTTLNKFLGDVAALLTAAAQSDQQSERHRPR